MPWVSNSSSSRSVAGLSALLDNHGAEGLAGQFGLDLLADVLPDLAKEFSEGAAPGRWRTDRERRGVRVDALRHPARFIAGRAARVQSWPPGCP